MSIQTWGVEDIEVYPIVEAIASKKIRVASFFSGAGGLDLGFHSSGFETVFASDIEKVFCQTLERNKPKYVNQDCVVSAQDIRTLKPQQIGTDVDLFIGGPPCQTFSASGRRAGGAAGQLDDRGTLFQAYADLIQQMKPKAFVFENVRGILGSNGGEDWIAVKQAFASVGYSVHHRILDAADYGAPQYRERVFLVGTPRNQKFLFPRPTHGSDSIDQRPHVTIREAFKAVKRHRDTLKDLALSGGKYSHLLSAVPPGDNYLYFTEKRGHPEPIFAYRSRFSDFLYKADPALPVKTVIASPGKYTGPLHWKNRYFSQGEYLAIQGFPQDYKVAGKRSEVIKQIGNAVSPHVGYAIAKAIAAQIFDCDVKVDLLQSGEILSFDKRKGRKAARTKAYHKEIAARGATKPRFTLSSFASDVTPSDSISEKENMTVTLQKAEVCIKVRGKGDDTPFADLTVVFPARIKGRESVTVTVKGRGTDTTVIQTMWNALDLWVRESSSYHSLFELYGHFTEPYPKFEVRNFVGHLDTPIVEFAKHAADFSNCSRYFPKSDLTNLLSESFGTEDFNEIATHLRQLRYDIRTRETNIAVPKDVYMLAYPFTLPSRRQMNFSIKPRETEASGISYVNFVRGK